MVYVAQIHNASVYFIWAGPWKHDTEP